jgi:hypothetical protein
MRQYGALTEDLWCGFEMASLRRSHHRTYALIPKSFKDFFCVVQKKLA